MNLNIAGWDNYNRLAPALAPAPGGEVRPDHVDGVNSLGLTSPPSSNIN